MSLAKPWHVTQKLEHLLIGYTGTIGSYVMATADGLIRASRPGESASWRADGSRW